MNIEKNSELLSVMNANGVLEAKYRELVENANSIILRLDSKGNVTFFNEFAQKFFGFGADEIIGRNAVGTIVPEKDSNGHDLKKMIRNIIKHPEQYENNENENIKKDGSGIWVAWTNKAVFDEKGKILHVLCIGNDITDRKNSQESERKAHRALKMLSECNRALIHGKDEQALLNEVCRIIVEIGGYVLAWVGEAKRDEYKSVIPIAHRGFDGGYLDVANVSWSNKTIKGRGPTGTSIRKKRIFIGKNFYKDRKLAPWRNRAIKKGYASSIALPLESDGEVFGALTIYAAKPYAFENEEEVKLLAQLANDLSFGVTALRIRKSREKAEEQLIESYKHLGTINRKVSLLLDLNQGGAKKNKKEVVEYILDSAINLSRAAVGMLYRLEENNVFCLLSHRGMNRAQKKKVEKIGHKELGALGLLLKQKKMLRGSVKEHHLGKLDFDNKLKYFVMLPLGLEKSPKGVLFLGFSDRESMESQELEFLDIFSVHTSSALFSAGILKYS
jgi:PAS domain S-box-containing protein